MPLTDEIKKEIFSSVKSELKKCTPPMVASKDGENVFELIGNKPVPYGSTKKIVPGMYFSSVVARKDMVSFYFFPMYMDQDRYLKLMPTLKKYLKGKTCFNFKKPEQVISKELGAVLKMGIRAWQKSQYMQ